MTDGASSQLDNALSHFVPGNMHVVGVYFWSNTWFSLLLLQHHYSWCEKTQQNTNVPYLLLRQTQSDLCCTPQSSSSRPCTATMPRLNNSSQQLLHLPWRQALP
jgi:hypothetical protein